MKYLVIDFEVANSFDKVSKICSFGYVALDSNLNFIDKVDIIINPEDKFDYHLYSDKSNIKLYYSKKEFYKHPNFLGYYDRIYDLFTSSNIVFGFSIENDIKFLFDTCKRYSKEAPKFNYLDVQVLFKLYHKDDTYRSLDYCINYYNIKTDSYLHKSDDDAYMTYLVLLELLKEANTNLDGLLKICKFDIINTDTYLKIVEERRIKKEERREAYLKEVEKLQKLLPLYDKVKDDGPLKGNIYTFTRNASKYIEKALDVQKYIYELGGMTTRHFSDGCYVIINDDAEINIKFLGAKFIKIDDIYNR